MPVISVIQRHEAERAANERVDQINIRAREKLGNHQKRAAQALGVSKEAAKKS